MTDDLAARITRLEDRTAIEELTARYTLHAAACEADRLAGLFTDDGLFLVRSGAIRGRAELEDYFGQSLPVARPTPIVGQIHVTFDSPVRARLQCLMASTFAHGQPGGFCGHYDDEVAKVDGQWLFAIRRFVHYQTA